MSSHLPSRPVTDAARPRAFAIVASEYNPEFVDGLINATRGELEALAPGCAITLHRVPGAFEIPVIVQEVALRGGLDAVIALGVIIQGGTAHAELIGRSITEALMRIGLDQRLPVIHEVLLVKDEEQARVRTLGHEINRGIEAARAAVRVSDTFHSVRAARGTAC